MNMDKVTASCIAAQGCGSGFWLYRLLNELTPDQWTAVGVLGTLAFSAMTFAASIAFKVWDRKHNYIRRDDQE